MAHRGKGQKVPSLEQKKDATNTSRATIMREAEEFEATIAKMEAMVGQERMEYVSQKKGTLSRKMKATIKKLLRKDKPKKKMTTLYKYPIVAASIKFHKDDDVDPAVEKTTGGAVEGDGEIGHE
ncbi:hypothetical protein BS78_05G085700 [Paspalum vaginatum]|nr:hypothetical protein BS78_05G085700 [Paspalum vaginatum]